MTDAQSNQNSNDDMDLRDVEEQAAPQVQAMTGHDVANRDTDRANGQEFAAMFHGQLLYVPLIGWKYYDERRWVDDIDRTQAITRAGELADVMWLRARQQDEQQREITRNRAKRLEKSGGLHGMLTFAASMMTKPITEFDTSPYLINCPNGTFDLRTGEDVGRSPTHYITRLCPTPLELDAEDEIWAKVVIETFSGDKDKMRYYRRFMGYSCTGDVREKKFLTVVGPTDAAKSTISEPFQLVLGDVDTGGYATVWDAEVVQANSKVNREEKLNKSRAARFIIVGELEKGSHMADGFVKKYTGGVHMDARALYKGSYSYRPTAKLLMDTNYVPKSSDPALHKRLVLLPVNHIPACIDPSIKKHLEEDLGAHKAILAWAVRGCMEWWEEKSLGDTPWLESAKKKYIQDSDPLVAFVEACFDTCEIREDSAHSDDVWGMYSLWAKENVTKPMSKQIFTQAMEERGHSKARVPARGGPMKYVGIKSKPFDELPSEVKPWATGRRMSGLY